MSLLDELKQQKAEIAERLERACADVQYFDGRMADLLLAIAALEPTPAPIVNTDEGWELEPSPDELFEAEKSEAREQLEREPEIPAGFTKWESGYCPFDIGTHVEVLTRNCGVWPVTIKPEAPLLWEHEGHDTDIIAYRVIEASPVPIPFDVELEAGERAELAESEAEGLGSSLIAMGYGDDDASEFAEPMPDPEFVVLDEQTCEPVEERPALNEAMQDEREEPVTEPLTIDDLIPEAMRQAVEAEQYAQPTNPEADERAKALDWYDPKASADRNRFNPFAMFKREDA